MPRMTGNRYFAEAVHAYGITHVFFVPTIMLPAMAEMEDMGIRRVVTHGEKAAAYMADGYARASRRPGLCLAQTIGSASSSLATGTIFTRHEFDRFYAHVPERVLIILDEAYFEYAKDNPRYPDSMHYRYDNVITLRTFSKVYGLAGARIGYGFAHQELIANLLKVKLPFEPSTLAQAAGIGALADKEFLHRSLELNARGIRLLAESLGQMEVEFVPSEANFVMIIRNSEMEASRLTTELVRQGVIVRPLKAFGLPHCLRISTGTGEENQRCVEALKKALTAAVA